MSDASLSKKSRKPLVAGNWKMHHGGLTGVELAGAVARLAREVPHVELVIAPPYTALAAAAHECDAEATASKSGVRVGIAGQNMHEAHTGAFTGEVSASMLKDSGCTWVILGHSERRQHFGETDASVAAKTTTAFKQGLVPIVCIGETLAERDGGHTLQVVKRQLDAVLPVLEAHASTPAAIAYEPVWAIGTGKHAGPAEAEEVHAAIRGWLAARSATLAAQTRILYGGSVKGDNASGLLSCPNIDGALVGGASLDAVSFGAIARAADALASP